jgi:hypothetical protein
MPIPPRTTLISSLLVLCIALAVTGVGSTKRLPAPAPEMAAKNPCDATTDAQLVSAVQAKIKADKRFDDQWKHINVSSTNRIVIINGWAKGKEQVNALINFARTTKCVRKVTSKLATRLRVGCDVGQKQCGDICIDRNEQCNLIGEIGGPPQ